MSRTDYGTVEVVIGGTEYTLKPTLAAYQKIDSRMGGLRQAIEACANMSIDGIVFIVAAGAGIGQRDVPKLAEDVFHTGASSIIPKVSDYLLMLLNPSGKEPEAREDDQGE